jgi:tRNA A37 threonylcarbamoyladenosine dehydratase
MSQPQPAAQEPSRSPLAPPRPPRKGKAEMPLPPDLDHCETLPRHQRRFDRTARLLGDRGMTRLQEAHVVVFGVGGVGSFAIESLARSGVGRLTLVDFDDICVTNSNRQLHTLKDTYGRGKTSVMAERCRLINPRIEVITHEAFYEAKTSEQLLPPGEGPDFVVDAIDNITAKCHLLDTLRGRGIPVVTSMGAAARMDPTQIRVADIKDTYNDPFARDIRSILRRSYGWDLSAAAGIPAVFSIERPHAPTALYYDRSSGGFQCVCPPKEERGHSCDDRVQVEGSLGFVTGAFGLACAAVVVNRLIGRDVKLVGLP